MSTKFVSGKTIPGATPWLRYSDEGIYVDIDTRAAGFTRTPKYVTSLVDEARGKPEVIDKTSVHNATPTGFRVCVRQKGLTPDDANSSKWHLNWFAVGE